MLLKSAFRECCRKSLLNRIIWDKVRGAVRPEVARTFVDEIVPGGEDELHYEDFPEEWSCVPKCQEDG